MVNINMTQCVKLVLKKSVPSKKIRLRERKTKKGKVLTNELPQESDQFRFLRASCFANLKGVVGLIMVKSSSMRISIPFGPGCCLFY